MEGHRELTTWPEVEQHFDSVKVTPPEAYFSLHVEKEEGIIFLRYVGAGVPICAGTFNALKPAFRFWVKDEPLEWKGERRASCESVLVRVPEKFAGKKVEVHVKEVR